MYNIIQCKLIKTKHKDVILSPCLHSHFSISSSLSGYSLPGVVKLKLFERHMKIEDYSKATQLQEYESRLELFINRFPSNSFPNPFQVAWNLFQRLKAPLCIPRSIRSSGCSIYRELLRLHFEDEATFCEEGILDEACTANWGWWGLGQTNLTPFQQHDHHFWDHVYCPRPGWWVDGPGIFFLF